MLGKRIINTGTAAAACTTDTVHILDGGTTQSKALYRFEDNANDTAYTAGTTVSSNKIIDLDVNGYSSGATISNSASNTDDATKYGTATYSNPSGSNGRFDLDGASDYLQIDASTTFNGATNYTLEGWFKPDNLTALDHFFSIHDGSSGSKFYVRVNDAQGDIDAMVYGSTGTGGAGGASIVTSNTAARLQVNVFNHVVMTYTDGSGGLLSIYINGVLAGSAAATGNGNTTGTANFFIGVLGGHIGSYDFDGEVGQVRFYISALSATEVLQNYNATKALYAAIDGTASNVTYATGKFDKAAVFNGSSSDIIVSGFNSMFSTKATFTVSLWFKTTATGNRALFDDYTSNNYNIQLYLYDGILNVATRFSGGDSNMTASSTTYNDGNWHHVAVTSNQTTYNTYIDGGSPNTWTASSNSHGGQTPTVTIGASQGGTMNFFSGEIDQVRIFDKALNSGEINSLYNETATTAALGTIDNPSTVAYYKMSDATDETGSYNGTATNVDFNVAGKYGIAGAFNGSSSLITLPSGLNQNNNFSWSFWVNFNALTLYSSTIVLQDTYRNMIDLDGAAGGSAGAGSLHFYDGVSLSSPSGTVTTGIWYHIVITKSSSTGRKMYVNNSEVASDSSTANSISGGGQNLIGAYNSGSSTALYLDGKIDQVRIFNKAISVTEVSTLYEEVQCASAITPSEHFNISTYQGDDNNNRQITTVGFQPDLVWIKRRVTGSESYALYDSIRGPNKQLSTDTNAAQATNSGSYQGLPSFDTNGFSVGNNGGTNRAPHKYVAWSWYAPTSETSNAGDVTATIKKNVEAGFSIVNYSATANQTVAHGLGAPPELIIKKPVTTEDWLVYSSVAGTGAYQSFTRNEHGGGAGADYIYSRSNSFPIVNSTVFSDHWTSASLNYTAYCFRSIEGYSRISSYTGTGSATGNFVYTGFEVAFLLVKRTDATADWFIFDNKRKYGDTNLLIGPFDGELRVNKNYAEDNYDAFNFTTNGFQVANSGTNMNASGGKYLFMAFAQDPDTTAPTKDNSFKTVLYGPGNGSTLPVTGVGFRPDFVWLKNKSHPQHHYLMDSVRGPNCGVFSSLSDAEFCSANYLTEFGSDGFTTGSTNNISGNSYVSWNWKAADHDRQLATINQDGHITSLVSANQEGGFSIVKYKGATNATTDGSNNGGTGWDIGHGLGVAPALVIIKKTSGVGSWYVGSDALGSSPWSTGNGQHLRLNETGGVSSPGSTTKIWNSAPTTTTFNVGGWDVVNRNGDVYIAYCFANITGYQQIGSYQGSTTTPPSISTGFSPSFVVIKQIGTNPWVAIDSARAPSNPASARLRLNATDEEYSAATEAINRSATGFTVNSNWDGMNDNSNTYLYWAIK